MSRLPAQPGERIDRERPIAFSFDGRPVGALSGDTIASALYAAGQRTFSRSFKYHRKRGLLCCAGQCPNCMVAVDGAPGVRACTEPVRDGMTVEHMNAAPSLEHDAMAVVDAAGTPFTPPGFYYKTFIRPRRLWPLYRRLLRNAAGIGRLPASQPARRWRTEYRRRHADLLVVGGGGAGLRAAIEAAQLGADVVLAEDGPEPGGGLLFGGGHERARELARRAAAAGVEILTSAPALGFYDGIVPVWSGDTLHQVRARRHVFATGVVEQPLVFAGNDTPGVMLSGAVLRLLALYAVRPGSSAVVATTGERGWQAAAALAAAGVRVRAIADSRERAGAHAPPDGAELLTGWTVLEAAGRRGQVERAVLGPAGGAAGAPVREYACDLIVVSGGAAPATSLPEQAGARTAYDAASGHFKLVHLPAGVDAAGELAGAGAGDAAEGSGALAGIDAAHALGLGDAGSRERAEAMRAAQSGPDAAVAGAADELEPAPDAAPPAIAGAGRGKCFACLCEDVTAKDIDAAGAEGYDSIELAKRYTTVTMGPCQGRMCQLPAVRLMARSTGQSLAQLGTTTSRPPFSTVPLGALAGRPFEPAKRSAIHARHRELGANVQWAGDWRRAYDYGDPQGEALAVHEAAGLIDVSTLGKLLVRGPDAGALLDRLYPNRLSNLKPWRVRYGVLSTDAGRIMDDGTICRLGDDGFYVTTTSSGAGAVEQWFAWWQAEWDMDAQITDLTQGLAAVNLAGPRSREILARVTDLDCSGDAFGYLDARSAEIAGVPCLSMRIGFVGELGYELHFPAAYGEDLWDRLLAAGADAGLRPFGLEPQRILRLQKMHILVGQDTDSESTPFGASMPWIVKLDKEQDFVGRWALEHAAANPAPATLVGFTFAGEEAPLEGSAILDAGGAAAGQVTSARYSRQLGRVIGMAWVPAALASAGSAVTISDRGRRLRAEVVTEPFFDPAGEVLRS